MHLRPAIVFLIPFASRRVKSQWEIACAHLRQTLRSIQNSTSGNYCVVVAGHEAPDFDVRFDSRFHFLSLTHPIPSHEHYHASLVLDKLTKIASAWDYARSTWNPRYVMKLDADDFISSRLVAWIQTAGGEAGYLIKNGWVWGSGSHYFIQHTECFDRTCGSCLIIRSEVADQTGPFLSEWEGVSLDEAGSRFAASNPYSLVPGFGMTTVLLTDSCTRFPAQFAYLGHKLSAVPFSAVVYRTGNPDSVEGRLRLNAPPIKTLRMIIGKMRRTRFITQSLRREFMLG
jgi:hypothetical protein